jgi:peptide/nickel transport system substrate-binding protein
MIYSYLSRVKYNLMGHSIAKLLLLFSLSLLIFSCKQDIINSKDNVVDIRLAKQPEKLNPVFFPNALAREVNQYIFLPLADFSIDKYELEPLMIKSIPSATIVKEGPYKDHIQYTFEILEEAKWDDGKPVTGEDYLFTYKAILHPGTSASGYRSLIKNIAAIEVDTNNNKRVSVYYKNPYINAKELVVNVEILPKHIYDPFSVMDKVKFTDLLEEANAEKLISTDTLLMKFAAEINGPKFTKDIVVGSGPYKMEAWNTDQNIILNKKENYWAKNRKEVSLQQVPEKIVFHFIPDEAAAIIRLFNKEIDVLTGVSMNSFEQLKKDSSSLYTFHNPQLIKYYHLLINQKDPILKSNKVRKALASVINVDQYIHTFEAGSATRTIGCINPVKPYYNNNIVPYKFDIEAAKNFLKEDGWIDTNNNGIVDKKINGKIADLSIVLYFSGELGQNISLLIKEEAKKAGMNIEIIKKDIAQLRKENLETGKYSAALQSASADLSLDDLELRFHSKNAELGEGNLGFYINPKLDTLIEAINDSQNDADRNKMYMEAQAIIHEDLPYIFLYSPKERIITTKNWKTSSNAKRPGYQANTFIAN